jgi:hypothetical protein
MNEQQSSRLAWRERYRLVVSLLIIPLGGIIIVRAALVGVQAWTLIVLGVALIGLGILRLRAYVQHVHTHEKTVSRRKRA